jgi:hypothetical protein
MTNKEDIVEPEISYLEFETELPVEHLCLTKKKDRIIIETNCQEIDVKDISVKRK